ncbi:uncharacterized protein LOC5504270 isoform X2 [Nematostella vectensis]|uniref:uncharacterized protein LOC5504270 isoform X2 n=1 Tax=Nematostella vectensis TaxID=45351 RepID=UPI0020774398|nr:uncharacterized protein LOC5504270 isoform X2 [Nematostella vectensis]
MAEENANHGTRDFDTDRKGMMEKWLIPLKEDLASWISRLLGEEELNTDTFTSMLDTGVVLCRLANFIQTVGEEFFVRNPKFPRRGLFPACGVTYKQRGATHGSFVARDNVSNFIRWCRELRVPDVIMFETEDLVLNKNEKTVLLTLLEVARKAFKVGVEPPELVRLENEIDQELELEPEPLQEPAPRQEVRLLKKKHKSHSLDDLVYEVLDKCTCPTRYPVQRIADGKYKMGDSKNLIFVRVMRKHVMVRVGGGWDTLDRYFDKHDPCRNHDLKQRRPSRTRPSSSQRSYRESQEQVRSPSSMSLSSTESHDSGSTIHSHMSVPVQVKHRDTCRHRTGPATRCISPGPRNTRSPLTRGATPQHATDSISNRPSRRSASMQDLNQSLNATAPAAISTAKTRGSGRRATSETRKDSKSAPGTPGQRRKSVAVTPPRLSAPHIQRGTASPRSVPPRTMDTQGKFHARSRSMQDLNVHRAASPTGARTEKSRALSATRSTSVRGRPGSEGPRRQSIATTPRKATSTTPVGSPRITRRQSSAAQIDTSRVKTTGSPRKASSVNRSSTFSPANSPRVTRKQITSSDKGSRSPGKVAENLRSQSPGTKPLTEPFTRSRSAIAFDSRPRSATDKSERKRSLTVERPIAIQGTVSTRSSMGPIAIQGTVSARSSMRPIAIQGTQEKPNPQRQYSSPQSPTKSRIPLMIKSPAKSGRPTPQASRPRPSTQDFEPPQLTRYYSQDQARRPHRTCECGMQVLPHNADYTAQESFTKYATPQVPQNGYGGISEDDFRTPFDDYVYTSEDSASVLSESVSECDSHVTYSVSTGEVANPDLHIDLTEGYRGSKQSSGETTPSDGGAPILSDVVRDYDYFDVETELRSTSSDRSRGSTPSMDLLESRDPVTPSSHDQVDSFEEGYPRGLSIKERLKSLNVGQTSISPTLRGKVFAGNEDDGLGKADKPDKNMKDQGFLYVDYATQAPEERSKFFDIDREMGQDNSAPGSPKKVSLVKSLIGSIEKRKRSDPQPPNLKQKQQPTEPRTGGEVVTGSRDVSWDCAGTAGTHSELEQGAISSAVTPLIIKEPFSDQALIPKNVDENKNITRDCELQMKSPSATSLEDRRQEEEELRQFEENENNFIVHESKLKDVDSYEAHSETHKNEAAIEKSPKRSETLPKDIDVFPRSPRQFSLDEMIADMLPGDSKSDRPESPLKPHFQALI